MRPDFDVRQRAPAIPAGMEASETSDTRMREFWQRILAAAARSVGIFVDRQKVVLRAVLEGRGLAISGIET